MCRIETCQLILHDEASILRKDPSLAAYKDCPNMFPRMPLHSVFSTMFIVHHAAEKKVKMHQMPEEKPRPLWAAEATYTMHTRRLLRPQTFRITPLDTRQRLLEKQE